VKVLNFDFIMLGRIQLWFVLGGPIKEYYLYSITVVAVFFLVDELIGPQKALGAHCRRGGQLPLYFNIYFTRP